MSFRMDRANRVGRVWSLRALLFALAALACGTSLVGCSSKDSSDAPVIESKEGELWTDLGVTDQKYSERSPANSRTFRADTARLLRVLDAAEKDVSEKGTVVLELPFPDGTVENVLVKVAPLLSPELAEQYPEFQTFIASGLDDATASGRLDHTTAGFHGMLITERGTLYVDPAGGDDPSLYVSYWKPTGSQFDCHNDAERELDGGFSTRAFPINHPSGAQLSTYRLAVSATGEYTTFFGGAAGAAAQITTTINRVTGIYERDLAIRLQLVATNIYTDAATDPFTGDNVSVMRGENQTDLDAVVGSSNYDIGHIFSQGGSGGIASLATVCGGQKAWGATSLGNPSGDAFDVNFAAHEMGHQFGGNHTWVACVPSQFVASAAYEVGSGTTIMAYAGVCSPSDIQPHSDDYFHVKNFEEITDFRDGAGACGVVSATGNTPPTVEAGPNCTIPRSTPFTLTAQGDDADGDALTFTWEQYDLGGQQAFPQSTDVTGPLFRSRPPSTSPSRTFPQLADLLSGAPTTWEVLPSVDRTMSFRVTARDNRANGGGADYDSMSVTVSGSPFTITAPSSTLECGGTANVTWQVGGGSIAPNVNVQLSSDGGATFANVLAGTANDGAASISVPVGLSGGQTRIRLVPSAECFFALSGPLSITDTADPTVTAPPDIPDAECTAGGTAVAVGSATATDQCDSSLSITNDAPALFPLGPTTVTWTATDDSGNDDTDTQLVTVVDTTPPAFTAVPGDITTTTCGSFSIGTATATDGCDTSVTVTNDRPAQFPPGTTIVTWTATDASGNVATATQSVTVILGDNPACCPAGTNIIQGNSNNNVLNGTNGSDCILGKGAQDTINGNGGNDYISGGDGNDVINGGGGNDVIFAGSGQDIVNGNDGADYLDGGDGDDTVYGGAGNDTLHGGQGQDSLQGQDGDDALFGDSGDDNLQGGNGNDALVGGTNNDHCNGGAGANTIAQCEFGAPNACIDDVQNGTETGIDCGGACPHCPEGGGCASASDCQSGLFCVGGSCELPPGGSVNPVFTELVFDTDWGSGYCARLSVTNDSAATATGFTVTLAMNGATIYTSWNATFSGGSMVTVTPFASHATLTPGENDSSIGFCANRAVPGVGSPSVVSTTATF